MSLTIMKGSVLPSEERLEYITPQMFGAVGDGMADDSDAFLSAIAEAIKLGLRKVVVPAGFKYVISKELNLGGINYDGKNGVFIEGEGVDNTLILFKPSSIDSVLFNISGGHGTTTGRSVRRLSIKPFNDDYIGLGTGVLMHDTCFVVVEDVNVGFLNKGINLLNLNPMSSGRDDGDFTEFCRISRVRTDRNNINVHYQVTKGNSSFHGVSWRDIQCQLRSGSEGFVFESSGSRAHPYANLFDNINFFGTKTGDCNAIRIKNSRIDVSDGFMTLEQGATFKSEDDSWFHISGNLKWLVGGSNVIFDCPATKPQLNVPAHFIFDNITSSDSLGGFTDADLSAYKPSVLRTTWGESSDLSSPGFIRILSSAASNVNGMASILRQTDIVGWYWGNIPETGTWQNMIPKYNLSADGSTLQGFSSSGRMYLRSKHAVSGNTVGVFIGTGTFSPDTDNIYSCGSSSLRWNSLFTSQMRITDLGLVPYNSNAYGIGQSGLTYKSLYLNSFTMDDSGIMPTVTNKYPIGSENNQISNIHTNTLTVYGSASLNGNALSTRVPIPSSAMASGAVGQWASDEDFLYVCVSTNKWKRTPLSSW